MRQKPNFQRKRLSSIQFAIGGILMIAVVVTFSKMNTCGLAARDNNSEVVSAMNIESEVDLQEEVLVEETETVVAQETKPQEIVEENKEPVKKQNSEYDYMVNFIAHLINGEAGCDWCTDEHQQLVGYVFCNRVRAKDFPNTFEGVLKNGYACAYDGNFNKTPTKRAQANAKIVVDNYLAGTIPVSKDLIYQAEFKQGSRVYKQLGNTYFCYR